MAIDTAKIYTVAEFEALPEFNNRYELTGGRLSRKPMPGLEHALICAAFLIYYHLFDPSRKMGLLVQESTVTLGDKDAPIPDLSFWKAERIPVRTSGAAPTPDLVIEVWSPTDLEHPSEARAKIKRYLEAGITLVWAVNPENRTVEVYRPDRPVLTLGIDESLDGQEIIPGFQMPVSKLFE